MCKPYITVMIISFACQAKQLVVLMGDDVQLPPVGDTPVYIQDWQSAPSNHSPLVWTTFDSAVELTDIVRQTESEQQLRGVLMS